MFFLINLFSFQDTKKPFYSRIPESFKIYPCATIFELEIFLIQTINFWLDLEHLMLLHLNCGAFDAFYPSNYSVNN